MHHKLKSKQPAVTETVSLELHSEWDGNNQGKHLYNKNDSHYLQHYHFCWFFYNFQIAKWAQQLSLTTKINTEVHVCICKPFQDKQSCRIIGVRRTGLWRSMSSNCSSCSNWTYFHNEPGFLFQALALSAHTFSTFRYGKHPGSLESLWRDPSSSSSLLYPRRIAPCCLNQCLLFLIRVPLRGPSLPLHPLHPLCGCLTAVPNISAGIQPAPAPPNPVWLWKAQWDNIFQTQLQEPKRAII